MTLFLTLPPESTDSIKTFIESDGLPIVVPKLVRQSGYIKDELIEIDDLSKPKLQRQIAYYKMFVFSPMVKVPYKEVVYSPIHYNIYDDDIILL